MTRTHIVSLMVLIVAIPAATASSFFASSANPCFIAGHAGYRISGNASANYTVRIDNMAPSPNLRLQIVDDPAAANFVLLDDGDEGATCKGAAAINIIRIDPVAPKPDLIVALSRSTADTKIYVRSAHYTEQDAAALFAVIWQTSAKNAAMTGAGAREFAERR
ncbi:MAG: hypothetical protein EXR03_05115 [Pseudolabrys sp.]|nr:hypothetical protein [Pseudolabrys sp.]MSP32187.1 hypothetical protein [Pseudolabrys sp.]